MAGDSQLLEGSFTGAEASERSTSVTPLIVKVLRL